MDSMNSNPVDSAEQQNAAYCTKNAGFGSDLQRNATIGAGVVRRSGRIEPSEFDDMLGRASQVLEARAQLEPQGRAGA